MPLALAGSLMAVQFRYPAELLLNLNKIEPFSKALLQQPAWLNFLAETLFSRANAVPAAHRCQ